MELTLIIGFSCETKLKKIISVIVHKTKTKNRFKIIKQESNYAWSAEFSCVLFLLAINFDIVM